MSMHNFNNISYKYLCIYMKFCQKVVFVTAIWYNVNYPLFKASGISDFTFKITVSKHPQIAPRVLLLCTSI